MRVAVHCFEPCAGTGQALAKALGLPFELVSTHRFPDGELLVTVPDGKPDVVIAHLSLDRPNEKIIELALAAEAWRRQGARRLVLVAPYLAYMRQDQAFEFGQAISQKAIARLLGGLFDRIVTVDPHLHRTHRLADIFESIRADGITAAPALGDWLRARGGASSLLLLGPDEESTPLVQATAKRCGAGWLTFLKSRQGDTDVDLTVKSPEALKDRRVVIVDDICSSGATLAATARKALELGARNVRALVVHALLDDRAAANLREAGISELVSTDAVPHPTNSIALAPLLASALADEVRADLVHA